MPEARTLPGSSVVRDWVLADIRSRGLIKAEAIAARAADKRTGKETEKFHARVGMDKPVSKYDNKHCFKRFSALQSCTGTPKLFIAGNCRNKLERNLPELMQCPGYEKTYCRIDFSWSLTGRPMRPPSCPTQNQRAQFRRKRAHMSPSLFVPQAATNKAPRFIAATQNAGRSNLPGNDGKMVCAQCGGEPDEDEEACTECGLWGCRTLKFKSDSGEDDRTGSRSILQLNAFLNFPKIDQPTGRAREEEQVLRSPKRLMAGVYETRRERLRPHAGPIRQELSEIEKHTTWAGRKTSEWRDCPAIYQALRGLDDMMIRYLASWKMGASANPDSTMGAM
ncbi:hypothetical protein C8F04DRAFT_1243205 [Mycena alexandri]|uniref:Uncharacterized protein n=1 Tax=Mycena alexandri TaxID=1745969 RepID=A0AAD6WP55_9AGAR|nr:hypothetical protein C8F04DRAFT_1243205 [Mycena alexandri]